MLKLTSLSTSLLALVSRMPPELIEKYLPDYIKRIRKEHSVPAMDSEDLSSPVLVIDTIRAIAEIKRGRGYRLIIDHPDIRSASYALIRSYVCIGTLPAHELSEEDRKLFFDACAIAMCKGRKEGKDCFRADFDNLAISYRVSEATVVSVHCGRVCRRKKDRVLSQTVEIRQKNKVVFHVQFLYADDRIYSDERWFTRHHRARIFYNELGDWRKNILSFFAS